MEKEPKVTRRLTLDIPPEMHTRLKISAARRGKSMRELAEAWLANALDDDDKQQAARQGKA